MTAVAPDTVPASLPMPFSPQNRRFSTLIVAALAVFTLSMGAVLFLYHLESRDGRGRNVEVGTVLGFAGMFLVQVWGLVRQEKREEKADQSREQIHGKLDEIKTTAVEVKETAATVARQTNGELDAKIKAAISEAAAARAKVDADTAEQLHIIKHAMVNIAQGKYFEALAKLNGEEDLPTHPDKPPAAP